MIEVTALIADRTLHERLRIALSGRCAVRAVRTVDEFWAALRARPAALVVVEAGPRYSTDVPRLVRAVRARYQGVLVVAYCHVGRELAHRVFDLVHAGVQDLVFADVDDDRPRLVELVDRATHRGVTDDVMAHATAAGVPRDGLPLLRAFLDAVARPLSVKGVAGALGVHRRTLVKRLEFARLLAPRRSGRGVACS